MVNKKKLLAIGLDGGDLNYIQSRLDHLPHISKLFSQAEVFRPAAPESLSGSVWPTFYSASEPGHHGIYQHLLWDPSRMGLKRINKSWCYRKPFWVDLDKRGVRTIVLDVPYSFPNRLDHGFEVVDWGSHGQTTPLSANNEKLEKVLSSFGPSPIGRETPLRKGPKELRRISAVLKQSAARKAQLTKKLMTEFEWDFCMPIFAETHRAGHIFFSDQDLPQSNDVETPLLETYKAVDQAIGELIDAVDSQSVSVMIFSVHGMMADNNQSGLVPRVLDRINKKFMAEHLGVEPVEKNSSAVGNLNRGVVNRLRKLIPEEVQLAVAKASPDFFRAWVVEQEIVGGIDWKRTPAFALRTDIRSEIRLNRKGREKLGWLEPGSELEKAYVQFMKDVFLSLEDVDRHHKLVDEVVQMDSIFPGKHSHMLPDFAIRWKEVPLAARVYSPLIGETNINLYGVRGGDHRDEGFVLLDNRNDAVAPEAPARISDIAGLITEIVGATPANSERVPVSHE